MVRRRLLWALALGLPLGACAAIAVATGAFAGTTYVAITLGAQCHRAPGPPMLPAPCGDATTRALPYAAAVPAIASLTPYVILVRRWVRDAAPRPRSPGASIALLRVLTGCGIGVVLCASSLAGWSWLWMTLSDHVLHVGSLALLLTIALGCAYPLLHVLADRPAEGAFQEGFVDVGA